MFADSFLTDNLFEILGLIVTVGGIWLIVSQLNEARKTTEIDMVLSMHEKIASLAEEYTILKDLATGEDWNSLSGEKALKRLNSKEANWYAFYRMGALFEIFALMVRRKTLSRNLAYDLLGSQPTEWWGYFEKAVRAFRLAESTKGFYADWEWLAKELEKTQA